MSCVIYLHIHTYCVTPYIVFSAAMIEIKQQIGYSYSFILAND